MDDFTLNETLTVQAFYILLALVDRTLHGYGIRGQVARDSGSRLILATGTVYIVLKRLLKEQLVEQIEAHDGRPGVTYRYRLTSYGRHRFEQELQRMERVTAQARYKLGERVLRR